MGVASVFAVLGACIAFVHLKLLALNVRALVGQSRSVFAVAVSLGRAVITPAGFGFAVLYGAPALIAALCGFLLTRAVLVRRTEFLLP